MRAHLRAVANRNEVLTHELRTSAWHEPRTKRRCSTTASPIKASIPNRTSSLLPSPQAQHVRFTPSVDEREQSKRQAHKGEKSKRNRLTKKDHPAEYPSPDSPTPSPPQVSWTSKLKTFTSGSRHKDRKDPSNDVSALTSTTLWVHGIQYAALTQRQPPQPHPQGVPQHSAKGHHRPRRHARSHHPNDLTTQSQPQPQQHPPPQPRFYTQYHHQHQACINLAQNLTGQPLRSGPIPSPETTAWQQQQRQQPTQQPQSPQQMGQNSPPAQPYFYTPAPIAVEPPSVAQVVEAAKREAARVKSASGGLEQGRLRSGESVHGALGQGFGKREDGRGGEVVGDDGDGRRMQPMWDEKEGRVRWGRW